MIYIRLENDDIIEKNLKNRILRKFNRIKTYEIEDKILLEIKDLSNKTLNKLAKYLRMYCAKRVCISDNLLNDKLFLEFLKNENIEYLNGKWLFEHMMIKCIQYVCNNKKEKPEYQEISFLSNTIDWNLIYNIKKIATTVRIVNIVTNNENKFRKLEKELYEEKGIILNINNNYKKSLIKSDIILNIDFTEEELSKYTLPKKSCIINFSEEIKKLPKNFEGINSNFFEINMPRKYLNKLLFFKGFNVAILCESFIYKNTLPCNISNEILENNIDITFLEGVNGKIRKSEYLKLSKKIAN